MRPVLVAFLLLASLAGCLAKDAPAPAATATAPTLSASHPTFAKLKFSTDVTSPTDPIDAALGKSHDVSRDVDVPAGTGEMRVAIDVQPAGQDKAAVGDIKLKVVGADGSPAYESQLLAKAGKVLAILAAPAAGTYKIVASYRGLWNVGVVAITTPADFTPGIVLNVSSPEQTQVEHTFYPARITAVAGQPTRLTLYDYDPHAGIDNLQHDIVIPALDVKTEGRTTWGEVRTLDFTAPAKAGEYEFYCEFHKAMLKGVIEVG